MENQIWSYCVIGFLCVIVAIQWLTNKWAIEERDWLKNKCAQLMAPGRRIVGMNRLDDAFRNRNKRRA